MYPLISAPFGTNGPAGNLQFGFSTPKTLSIESAKAFSPKLIKLSPVVNSVRAVPAKAFSPIVSNWSVSFKVVRELQPLNALFGTFVTPPKETLTKFSASSNAPSPNVITVFGNSIAVSPEFANALSPISAKIASSSNEIVVKFLQPLKAPALIFFNNGPTVTSTR